jgi:hypothetical protein
MPPVVAPDVQVSPGLGLPSSLTVSAQRPLVIEANNRVVTISAPAAAADYQPIDNYGAPTGAAASLPATLPASGRWIVRHVGAAGESTPITFS